MGGVKIYLRSIYNDRHTCGGTGRRVNTGSLMFLYIYIVQLYFILVMCDAREMLLIFGDSVDRMGICDWCDVQNNFEGGNSHQWGDHTIKYGGQHGTKMPSYYCVNSHGDSVAFLHIFGSSNGPYLWVDTQKDHLAATIPRIKKGTELYLGQFGPPTRIIFASALWDLRPYRKDVLTIEYEKPLIAKQNITFEEYRTRIINEKSPSLIQNYKNDVISRMKEIKEIVGPSVNLGLRTAAWYEDAGVLLHMINNATRELSKAENLTLYDLDRDLWSLVKFDYSQHKQLFRDSMHPNPFVCAPAADKMLGRRFSNYYYSRGTRSYHNTSSSDDPLSSTTNASLSSSAQAAPTSFSSFVLKNADYYLMSPNYTISLLRVVPKDPTAAATIFYSYFETNTQARVLWTNISLLDLFNYFKLGFGDVLDVSEELAANFSSRGIFPFSVIDDFKLQRSAGISTSNGLYYIFINGQIRKLSDAFSFYLFYPTRHLKDFDPHLVQILGPVGQAFPVMFKEDSLIRIHNEKLIYVVKNYTRHAIRSGSIFNAHGYNFDKVVVITHSDMDIIPIGNDLVY